MQAAGDIASCLTGDSASEAGLVECQATSNWKTLRPGLRILHSENLPGAKAAFALSALGGGGSCNLRGGSFIVAWASYIAS